MSDGLDYAHMTLAEKDAAIAALIAYLRRECLVPAPQSPPVVAAEPVGPLPPASELVAAVAAWLEGDNG